MIPLVSTITYMRAINSVTQPMHKIDFDHSSSIASERAGCHSALLEGTRLTKNLLHVPATTYIATIFGGVFSEIWKITNMCG